MNSLASPSCMGTTDLSVWYGTVEEDGALRPQLGFSGRTPQGLETIIVTGHGTDDRGQEEYAVEWYCDPTPVGARPAQPLLLGDVFAFTAETREQMGTPEKENERVVLKLCYALETYALSYLGPLN